MKKIFLIALFFVCSPYLYAQSKSKAELEKELLEKAHSSALYKKVYADVEGIKIDIALAKKGTLSKAGVINHYNEVLSIYMGQKIRLLALMQQLQRKALHWKNIFY